MRFCNIAFYSAEDTQKAEEEWLPQKPVYRNLASESLSTHKGIRKACYWLWRTAVVNVNGGITPCCFFDVPDWGNTFDGAFLSVWNNEKYTEARMRSRDNSRTRKYELICDNCNVPFIYK